MFFIKYFVNIVKKILMYFRKTQHCRYIDLYTDIDIKSNNDVNLKK